MDINDYKIIDFEKRGNVVRLFISDKDDNDYWGDDWDDRPYEHNAGLAYGASRYVDIAFPLSYVVNEPADDWHYNGNSPFSKEDFKNGKAPCIIISEVDGSYWDNPCYSIELGNRNACKIYFNDSLGEILEMAIKNSGLVIHSKYN